MFYLIQTIQVNFAHLNSGTLEPWFQRQTIQVIFATKTRKGTDLRPIGRNLVAVDLPGESGFSGWAMGPPKSGTTIGKQNTYIVYGGLIWISY